ncbi:MAG: hypothetical protein E7620_00955 [Ruminococcaceae bacterium]|nr:hypothetical protein [Oscillospiraceae bacterium]
MFEKSMLTIRKRNVMLRLKSICAILLCLATSLSVVGCTSPETPNAESTSGTQNTLPPQPDHPEENPPTNGLSLREREDRNMSNPSQPKNLTEEETLPKVPKGKALKVGKNYALLSDQFDLIFTDNGGQYSLRLSDSKESYFSTEPIAVTVYTPSEKEDLPFETDELTSAYTSVKLTEYGYLATATLQSANGSQITVEDRYYFPEELSERAINVRRTLKVDKKAEADLGYSTSFALNVGAYGDDIQCFVPHKIYNDPEVTGYFGTYGETELGLPMAAMMTKTGFTLSLARYQPVIHPIGNYTASITVYNDPGLLKQSGISVEYPSKILSAPYFDLSSQKQVVFDLTFTGSNRESYNDMMVGVYNDHFVLQDQRIVNTDINKVWEVICKDYKSFLLSTDKNGVISYGLPWRVTIENGLLGPKSYQSGFVGQQVPAAYQMMLYGIQSNDGESLQNGLNILNFWIDSGMMTDAGVPKIWYNGDHNFYNAYPTFLRMAIDTMDGYLDAYRLALQNGIACDKWKAALDAFGGFLLNAQNEDGSYYRCYNWSGTAFSDGDNGIPEPAGNICQSTSKENTAMAVAFLADLYLLTGKEEYKQAAIAAGEYVYQNQYARGYYIGGTCDNANVVDKEAGVFAMTCYDAMYRLTKDEKWIAPLKQSAAFVMSMVQCFSFPAGLNNDLKAANGVQCGYNDGSSFITAEMNGLDNYAAVIYYQLFRIYVITGDPIYFYQAEFMQQNSKSLMDWDGALGYPYQSILPEASTIADFQFRSAADDQGIEGVWLPWQSVVNAAPICDMMLTFGVADVAKLANTPIEDLYQLLFP